MKQNPSTVLFASTVLSASLILIFNQTAEAEDAMMTSRYFDTAQKFDAALKEKKNPEDITKLADQYQAFLNKLSESLGDGSPYLSQTIQHEVQRLGSIRSDYLKTPQQFVRIRLDRDWTDCRQYKDATADFRKVLGVKPSAETPTARPDFKPDFGKGASLLGKPFLCPIQQFLDQFAEVKGLKLNKARVSIGMSGFPKNSFYYHSYDGDFSSRVPHKGCTFNRMYIVTDGWDQVVAVQFTSEVPRGADYIKHTGIGIFNFVQFRRKGSSTAWVRYMTVGEGEIHTLMGDSKGMKELNVLYLSLPTRQLIEYSLSIP
jgi:hypothetical protein